MIVQCECCRSISWRFIGLCRGRCILDIIGAATRLDDHHSLHHIPNPASLCPAITCPMHHATSMVSQACSRCQLLDLRLAMSGLSLRRSSRLVSATCATVSISRTATYATHVDPTELESPRQNRKKRVSRDTRAISRTAHVNAEDIDSLSSLTSLDDELPVETKKKTKRRKKADLPEPKPEDFLPRPLSFWKLGPHVSSAGGVENAIVNAASVGHNVSGSQQT
ncbi:hypothetical protein OBBRIDRAFT_466006 [Obba rivulosa]|uniref:Uncharacterized protein n=1 Tax=Obba rivulosa TaxID=1052685 RepID=A0A8E2B5E0_9APHY|nr:hypothetical protein OBBRIDRAFT_466006 [Obba rivulosa]